MTTAVRPETGTGSATSRPGLTARRWLGLAALVLLVSVGVALSLWLGSRAVSPGELWRVLWTPGMDPGSPAGRLLAGHRLPRTLLGLGVGLALGLAGACMQTLTRNPLADPGLLGVNAGAALGVVIALLFFGATSVEQYVWPSFVGAALAAATVFALGARGRTGATPLRLVLAGAAVQAALLALTNAIVIVSSAAFDEYRYWQVGSFAGRPLDTVNSVLPFLGAGVVLALLLARPLNVVMLGDDVARSLGTRVRRTRVLSVVAIVLLCGAATAAAGPIGFVGLAAPHVARRFAGPDQRWIFVYSAAIAAALLLLADVLARLVLWPGEVEVGIVTAFLGAPVFIWLVAAGRRGS